MHIKSFAARAIGAVAVLAFASAAAAQTAPAKPPAPAQLPITHGAPIAGVCIWDLTEALEASNAGKSVLNALKTMNNNVNYEVQTAGNAYQAKQKKLQDDARKPDADALVLNKAKLDLDSEGANLMRPLIIQVYQSKQCSLLLPRESTALFNPAMDITPAVVAAANAKGQTVPVTYKVLGKLPAPATAPAAPAAPAAPKPKTN
jgi:Skp family chaperone for outer membrane proteins